MSYSANIKKIEGVTLDTHDAGSMPADVRTWAGTAPSNLIAGRVDAYAGAVGDKTGYSLTAGSYSIRPSSTSSGTVAVAGTSNTGTITSVTVTRAYSNIGGAKESSANNHNQMRCATNISSATTVTATKFTTDGTSTVAFEAVEFF